MSSNKKIISAFLTVAVIFGMLFTVMVFAVDKNPDTGVESTVTETSEGYSEAETSQTDDPSDLNDESNDQNGGDSDEQSGEESLIQDDSDVGSITEGSAAAPDDTQEEDDREHYGGDVYYEEFDGSRIEKPGADNTESKPEKNKIDIQKNIVDYSYMAKKWIWLPILLTALSAIALIWFNLYAHRKNAQAKVSGTKKSSAKHSNDSKKTTPSKRIIIDDDGPVSYKDYLEELSRSEESKEKKRNFDRPKH